MPERACEREYPRRVTAQPPASPKQTSETSLVPGVGLTYVVGRWIIAPLARLFYWPRIEGRKNVPRKGPVILASNHLSFIDSFVIPMASPRAVRFLAKASYFEGKGLKGWFAREFFYAVGAFPVQRGAGQAALDALDQQKRMLEAGWATALYPEGTRSLDGRLYKGRTGVAFLALQTGAPVVPVGLVGTNDAMPVGAKFPRLRPRVTVRFGEPIDLSHHGPASSGRARRLATDEIMSAIHALSGQELANAYNETPAQNPVERIKQVLPHERR
ncbi:MULTISPECIES: lysophospholipid acyltransferase family protein [unclassified Microbacterium]|uniref:lysophospholipid acyltransferase family protein n=1 Tax=unclassified Microbacterium TaxID=2609290 RepID=UPI00214BA1EE|nr:MULTISPECIES: lysophospholipid acyltransferase family protein [unclassified Microbacterium]MCR2801577.1 1-acyl-sn-glycerol-3-phosphate acyltransferase [Microbacterium sp. zg.Y818]MCR2826068.1 1-acyl-sn-glycerol-3-phosphate acyltransferase [Microbacterium sp. zg.Y909]WIM23147.1 lysophospholipid acyltransferase family protein [Microbacterium sp. zg-Y818]